MTTHEQFTDTQNRQERTLVLNLDLSRFLVVALLALAVIVLAALLVRGPVPASASGEQLSATTDPMRRFYLAPSVDTAPQAVGACGDGYHFASLWEILDTSNLVYDTARGIDLSGTDSGSGPPTDLEGWVRTGYKSSIENVPGQGNCASWQWGESGFGTIARLVSNWTAAGDLYVWDAETAPCGNAGYVWCVED
jgi:hypothetical protein